MLDKLCAVAVLLFIITAFVMLLPRPASAGYLRFMDYRDGALHPAPLLGGFLAPDSITTESEGGGMLPIITHSSRVDASGHHVDGCLLPSIACEDWSPFAVGGSGERQQEAQREEDGTNAHGEVSGRGQGPAQAARVWAAARALGYRLPAIGCFTEGEGLEPPRACARRFSRPLPYQLGLALRGHSKVRRAADG